jgi:hypothetical protein
VSAIAFVGGLQLGKARHWMAEQPCGPSVPEVRTGVGSVDPHITI